MNQLASTWMNTSHTNRVFKGRDINRVSKTRFPGGRHVEKCQLRPNQNMKIEPQRLGLQALNQVF